MIRRKTLVVASILVVAAATLLTTAASGSPRHATTSFPRTLAGAKSYLASIGIDARTVVIQRGVRNYAGPSCPGKGWTCTTSTRVLQLGKDANKVDCSGGSVIGQSCTIAQGMPGQTTGNNSARCVERSNADVIVQDCNITQYGDTNTAIVDQAVQANGGPTQNATQTAEVMQTAASENDVHVHQAVHQDTHIGPTQTQDVHQELTVNQDGGASGDNNSDIKQQQNQDAHGGSSQSQNTTSPSGVPPCDTLFKFDPNQCALVTQTTTNGDNRNDLDQSSDRDQHTNAAGATQSQGSFSGGTDGHVEASSTTGSSVNDAHQKVSLDQHAPAGAIQSQIEDPGCCGLSAQGPGSSERIVQDGLESSSEPTSFQQLSIVGSSSSIEGSCSITQHGSVNSGSSSTPVSLSPCPALVLFTECSSGGEEQTPGCVSFQGGEEFLQRR